MAARTFRKKKQQQSRVFFDVIFDVYTHVDNRERAGASNCKQRRLISLQEKNENEKIKSEQEHKQQNFWWARTTVPPYR